MRASGSRTRPWQEGFGKACHPGLALCVEEGLGTAELLWLVQAARVTSSALFHLPANSEVIAKNYSILNTCQALLSCFTLIFFTSHSNLILECLCLQKNLKHSTIQPPTQSHGASKGKSLDWLPGRRLPHLQPSTTINYLSRNHQNIKCLTSLLRIQLPSKLIFFIQ